LENKYLEEDLKMEKPYVDSTPGYWSIFAKLNFALAVISVAISVYLLEVTLVTKGYFIISTLYMFTTTVVLSKTIRDEAESKKFINKIEEAKRNKVLED